MSTATLDAAIQRSAVERVRLINAQRLRKMMQSVGAESLKNLVQWVRALVRMILAPFRMIGGMLRLGGQGNTAAAAVEANGQLPVSAFAATGEDPSIDEAAFAEPAAAVTNDDQDGQAAGQAASAADDDAAVSRLVESLACGDKDLELELTGLPAELSKVKKQLESILAPILASGYTFADVSAGMDSKDMGSRVVLFGRRGAAHPVCAAVERQADGFPCQQTGRHRPGICRLVCGRRNSVCPWIAYKSAFAS
jgi:hypothetical protein